MSDNDRFEEFMERWAPEYNPPPETPRDEIWDGIRASLWQDSESEKVVPLRTRREKDRSPAARSWMWAAVGAAAVLVVGFGLGRITAPGEPAASGIDGAGTVQGTGSFRTAALSHFSETESFLTLVRGDARAGRVEPEVARWAGGLLAETRLLLDSPAAEDPAVRALLEDLELILVQVAGLEGARETGSDRVRQELQLLAAGMDDHDMLPRLQAMMPETRVTVGL